MISPTATKKKKKSEIIEETRAQAVMASRENSSTGTVIHKTSPIRHAFFTRFPSHHPQQAKDALITTTAAAADTDTDTTSTPQQLS